MTLEAKKIMLNGIINNNEQWECSPSPTGPFVPYNLGDEIHEDWYYRLSNRAYVLSNLEIVGNTISDSADSIVFTGTVEACKDFVETHKKWVYQRAKEFAAKHTDLYFVRMDGTAPDDSCKVEKLYPEIAQDFCEKLLRELSEHATVKDLKDVSQTIKSLGITY